MTVESSVPSRIADHTDLRLFGFGFSHEVRASRPGGEGAGLLFSGAKRDAQASVRRSTRLFPTAPCSWPYWRPSAASNSQSPYDIRPIFLTLLVVRIRILAATIGALLLACSNGAEQPTAPSQPIDLSKFEDSVFAQYGEDGVIQKIFEIIEPTTKYAVEFGAQDGVRNSNTRNLFLNHGWRGLLIEGDPDVVDKLHAAYADLPEVKTLESWVFPGNIEILFEENGVPRDLDLLVIDIDSNDYYVWKVLHEFRPKVVQIEINPFFPPPQKMVINFHPMNYWDYGYYFGASITSMIELGRRKGYEPIYATTGGFNLFFVDALYFERFGIANNSPEALYKGPDPVASHYSDQSPQGQGDTPFEKPHLDVGQVRIRKQFRFDR